MASKTGRPPKADLDDPEMVERICALLVSGIGIAEICKADDMPAESTVYCRMADDEEFRRRIARAREAQQEAEIDRTITMADAATAEDWQVVKLRIWARHWRAAKLAPKKYGDKVDLNVGGQNGDNPLVTEVRRVIVDPAKEAS